jgi:hypothetical protein
VCAALRFDRFVQACLDNYKQQLVGDPIVHTHLTALYGKQLLDNWIAVCMPPAGLGSIAVFD